jgi:L-rhamnose mutarotase
MLLSINLKKNKIKKWKKYLSDITGTNDNQKQIINILKEFFDNTP